MLEMKGRVEGLDLKGQKLVMVGCPHLVNCEWDEQTEVVSAPQGFEDEAPRGRKAGEEEE